MIIGNGLMASLFEHYKENPSILVFASGVSNSKETNDDEFLREFSLLKKSLHNCPDSLLIYFSTCSIYNDALNKTPYVKHKFSIEDYIRSNVNSYLIFRVSNVVGFSGNENTIINHFVAKILSNKKLELWQNAERNIIAADDVRYIVSTVIESYSESKIINVAVRKSLSVKDILNSVENYLDKEANITYLDKGNQIDIDIQDISNYLTEIEQKKGDGLRYFGNLLKTYYSVD